MDDEAPLKFRHGTNDYEEYILATGSHPRLKRNQLTRSAKRDHLDDLKCTRDEREKILDQLYPSGA